MTALHADWTELPPVEGFDEFWLREMGPDVPSPLLVEKGGLRAMVGREPVDQNAEDWRWHISVSLVDRIPHWGELVQAAHELRPGIVFVVGIPPRSWWLNVHPYTLHLWETHDPHLVEQWRRESQGHTPS